MYSVCGDGPWKIMSSPYVPSDCVVNWPIWDSGLQVTLSQDHSSATVAEGIPAPSESVTRPLTWPVPSVMEGLGLVQSVRHVAFPEGGGGGGWGLGGGGGGNAARPGNNSSAERAI